MLRGPGQPLSAPVKEEMEARLGVDLSDVRVHTGSAARASATELSARAYTFGSHVVIGNGGADKHTLVHELTHVIQQRQGPVAGTDHGNGFKVSDPFDAYERAAEANASRAVASAMGPGPGNTADTGQLSRLADRTAMPAPRLAASVYPCAVDNMLRPGMGNGLAPEPARSIPQAGLDMDIHVAPDQARHFDEQHIPTIQRMTAAHTAKDINKAYNEEPVFEDQVIINIRHMREGISNDVKVAVDAFGDCPAAGSYKHHVPYKVILDRIRDRFEGRSRSEIVEYMGESAEAVGIDLDDWMIDPMEGRLPFDAWLDRAIVAIGDWPSNIFRGPSGGDAGGTALDQPTPPVTPALTARLANAVATLRGLQFWP